MIFIVRDARPLAGRGLLFFPLSCSCTASFVLAFRIARFAYLAAACTHVLCLAIAAAAPCTGRVVYRYTAAGAYPRAMVITYV